MDLEHPGSSRRERKVMTMWIHRRALHRTLLPVMLYGGVSVFFTCCALFIGCSSHVMFDGTAAPTP